MRSCEARERGSETFPARTDAPPDPHGRNTTAADDPGAADYSERSAAMADTTNCTERRLARLLAALLWYDEEYYGDIYDLHFAEAGEACPDVGPVELTEDGRVEILAEGREYVLRVEPKAR